MTNRENITNQNIADLLVHINTQIPFKCVIECIDPVYSAGECYNYSNCLKCINEWLNCEVTKNVERNENTQSE